MSTIDSLNQRYIEQLNMHRALWSYREVISVEQGDFSVNATVRFKNSMTHLRHLVGEIDCSRFTFLSDVLTIAMQYDCCLTAIAEYQSALLQMGKKPSNSSVNVVAAANAVKTAQRNYDLANERLQEKYKAQIPDIDTLNSVILNAIETAVSFVGREIDKLKEAAKELLAKEVTTELSSERTVMPQSDLPKEFLVARMPVKNNPYMLLRDIGITASYENIFTDIRRSGNVLVQTAFENMSNDSIDAFVAAYILRYIESFPLGSVNVHIIDNNASFLFKRLCNSFQAENAGEVARKVVQIYSSMDVVNTFQDVICEDIFKKTTASCPDLYSIYENDKTDTFHLVVVRDGLVNNNGYASSEILDAVKTLTKIGGMGHRCGVRFLIIDDSGSFDKTLNSNVKFTLGEIRQNCELQFVYDGSKFVRQGKNVELLHITEDVDSYIQERSQAIARILATTERSVVSIDEIIDGNKTAFNESIMYIPVGKSGTESMQLPFSCKDDNGTVAGQCIGYMAIGQSGSGKSSFFHSVVLNGCLKYSPKELQFWLLDFKYGGASSKYSKSGLPHIRIIAENNKTDDALCLFQMIFEEMDRRNKAFNQHFVDNIIDYNRIAAENETMEYFPRIIIAIDEVQEIFRDDNASVLQKQISSISVRMRSVGMHFIMVAQNLCEGKSYMLKEAFLPSASGRICFRVAPNIARDSGFSEDFSQRKQEISELKTGEAYVAYGKGTIRKVKMAYASPEDMTGKYFAQIRGKYTEYAEMKPLVIGSKKRLAINNSLQKSSSRFYDAITALKPVNGVYSAIIGEDAYRMEPFQVRFSQYENSAVLLLGNHKGLSSSLCVSITSSLAKQGVRIHLFNGDKTKIQQDYAVFPHPFMYVCQNITKGNSRVSNYKLSELDDVLKNLYVLYLKRQAEVQKADDDAPIFEPEFLIINDLFAIESFVSNNTIENSDENAPAQTSKYDFLATRNAASSSKNGAAFRENIQTIMSTLLRNGFRYNIHVVLAIKGDPSAWRNSRIASEVNNVVLFNTTQFADHMENSYYLKEMLRNVANENGDETMAVWASKRGYSKVRPIIYSTSIDGEKKLIDALIQGV